MILVFVGKSIINIDGLLDVTPIVENDGKIERYRLRYKNNQVIGIDKKTMKKFRKVIKKNYPKL